MRNIKLLLLTLRLFCWSSSHIELLIRNPLGYSLFINLERNSWTYCFLLHHLLFPIMIFFFLCAFLQPTSSWYQPISSLTSYFPFYFLHSALSTSFTSTLFFPSYQNFILCYPPCAQPLSFFSLLLLTYFFLILLLLPSLPFPNYIFSH